jgi:hypothetical protein
MAEAKTKPNAASVSKFLAQIKDPDRRRDCRALAALMSRATGAKPKMWGSAIVGFGSYHCRYASGRECDWMVMGFSPRKDSLSLYLTCGLERLAPQLRKLGKHKAGMGCLYIKRLSEVDSGVLQKMIQTAASSPLSWAV